MWLYLFDIDGTLVHSGGAGRRAIEVAFVDVWGRGIPWSESRRIPFNGRTDLAILRDVGSLVGLDPADYMAREGELLARYLDVLPDEVTHSEGKKKYPGVTELLEALAREPDIRLGLLTGNLEGGARAKLAPFDLNRFFVTGGYGSDAIDRREIARIAHRRCEASFASPFPTSSVVVLGDTPADVDCARASGFHAVLVGTGSEPAGSLDSSEPDLYFEDFGDTNSVIDTLFDRFPPSNRRPS